MSAYLAFFYFCPFLIMHGEQDDAVPASQSRVLYERLLSAGVATQLVLVKNANHEFAPTGGPISPTRAELSRSLADFFDKHLKPLQDEPE